MSLPFNSSFPANSPEKQNDCLRVGAALRHLLEQDIKPRDILTREAFENAITVITVLGGSTNAVLHLIAMAKAAEVALSIDDFQRIADKTPFLADLKPSGKYVMEDLYHVGGVPAVMKMLLAAGMLHGDCIDSQGLLAALPETARSDVELEHLLRLRARPVEDLLAEAAPHRASLSPDSPELAALEVLVQRARTDGLSWNGSLLLLTRLS